MRARSLGPEAAASTVTAVSQLAAGLAFLVEIEAIAALNLPAAASADRKPLTFATSNGAGARAAAGDSHGVSRAPLGPDFASIAPSSLSRQISIVIPLLRPLEFVDPPQNSVDPPSNEFAM
jgi:hypothetical protein